MPRRNKLSKAQKRERRRRRDAERIDKERLIQDTAAVFTCFAKVIGDFAYQCDRGREDLECDLTYNRVAAEMWRGRSGRAHELAQVLAAFAAERERHLEALILLGERFDGLAADQDFHEHLEPIDHYREFIRRRIFPEQP